MVVDADAIVEDGGRVAGDWFRRRGRSRRGDRDNREDGIGGCECDGSGASGENEERGEEIRGSHDVGKK